MLSIVIPVKNDLNSLRVNLLALKQKIADPGFPIELIVVNDDADADISNFLKATTINGIPIKEINVNQSKGSYHARNLGIQQATYEWILMLDADVYLTFFPFQKLEQVFNDRQVLFIVGQIIYESQQSGAFQRYLSETLFTPERSLALSGAAATACLIVNREVFNQIGKFDESLYSCGDYEFSQRVYEAGFEQRFVPALIVCHRQKSFSTLLKNRIRIFKGRADLALRYEKYRHQFPFGMKGYYKELRAGLGEAVKYGIAKNPAPDGVNRWVMVYGRLIDLVINLVALTTIQLFPKKSFNW